MLEQEYRAHIDTVERFVAVRYGTAFKPWEREEICQEAFLGVERERAKGKEIKNTEALLITCAKGVALNRLASADRRRRYSFDPQDSAEARMPDTSAPVDVAVIDADEHRRMQMLMDQLDDERLRSVLKLRLELDLDPPEIADRLGVSRSHAYKLLKQAGRALSEAIVANDQGAHSKQQRAVLAACEMGTATAEQRRRARTLQDDPHARALLAELRGLGHQAAALMPPAVVVGVSPSSGRLSHMLSSVRQHLADLTGRAPTQDVAAHVAAGGGTRGTGTMLVAGVLSCAGVGGTALGVKECIDHGIGPPAALVGVLPGASDDTQHDARPLEGQIDAVEQLPVVIEAIPTPAAPDPSPDATDVETSPSSSEPAPAPARGGDSVSGLSGAPTPQAVPASPPPPTTGGAAPPPGGTAGSGSPGTAFGGGL